MPNIRDTCISVNKKETKVKTILINHNHGIQPQGPRLSTPKSEIPGLFNPMNFSTPKNRKPSLDVSTPETF